MKHVIPDAESVTQLLGMIFGEDIAVADATGDDFSGYYVATFQNREDKQVAVSACDMAFVAYSGAALSMVPKPAANDMIKDSVVTDAVAANFHEVMNICSKLMISETSPHLRLVDVFAPGDSSTQAVAAMNGESTTVCFDVDIPRYGKGRLSFKIE